MRDLLRYRFLFEQMVRRELRQKYQGSVLGIAWYIVNPLVLMGAYYLMFGRVFKVAQHDDYPLFLMVGLVVWIFFNQAVLGAAPSLLDHGSLIRKARFPRETIPAASVAVQFVTFLVVLVLVALVTFVLRGTLDVSIVLLPVVLAALFAFVLGFALGVAILHAYFRDVAPILGAVLLPWFFLSPIFFEPSDITTSGTYKALLSWVNPVAPFIEAVRDIVYGGVWPDGPTMLYVLVAATLVLGAGSFVFRRMQRELAVVV
ncbi:ABC transporter permease [Conexibacter sp. SYSU D00693]|uniref:ABC transporter permease n=1 Tax=Conexibacter sp. SYSU D00693 TaxID=2812560 RepID=UPI00196B1810|nr:ABC transporter permease [Conexibacter sp. SYSU D00693]